MADFTAFPKLEVLAEEPLLEHPALELRPLAEPLLEIWVVRVGQIHSFRGNKAVERSSNIEKHFALCHLISLLSLFPSLPLHYPSPVRRRTGGRSWRVSRGAYRRQMLGEGNPKGHRRALTELRSPFNRAT